MASNFLDRAISWFSPKRGLERAQARHRMSGIAAVKQAYDGATVGRRASGWRVVGTDADSEVGAAGARLRDVARDMVRNNPHAWKARQAITANTVGTGVIPSVTMKAGKDRDDLERLLREHFDTTACDADGRHDLYGLQWLVLGTVIESGEALIRYRPRRASDKLPLPFQLQVLEPDYIDSTIDGEQPNGNFAIRGVEFNKLGKRVAYHLFSSHPGGSTSYTNFKSNRVPASTILHVFRVDRPGQQRGVTWFAPVVLRLRDFAESSDAFLVRQKIAACFAAFITKVGEDGVATTENPDGGYPLEELGPGLVQRLREGESVTFGSPPQVTGYAEYTKTVLREIAAGMGISYEALVGDMESVNFSSGRMGWLEFQRSIDGWRNHMLIPQLCQPIGQWFLDAASAVNGKEYEAEIAWTPPRREMIDPTKEITAAIKAIRGGLSSRSYEVRKLGHDPEVLDAEIANDNARADELKLALDSDGRRMTGNGMLQVDPDDDDSET